MEQKLTKERKTKLIIFGIILLIIPFVALSIDPTDYNLQNPKNLIIFATALFGGFSCIYIAIIKKRN